MEFGEGEGLEFAAGFEAKADGVADDLVGFAEGDALRSRDTWRRPWR